MAAALVAKIVSACASPATPAPSPGAPSPQPASAQYRVSGVVTDEDGQPFWGVTVGLSPNPGGPAALRTRTDGNGYYQFDFQTLTLPSSIFASGDNQSLNIQLLDWAGSTAVDKNLRLRPARTINAGQSTVIAIEPDSSACSWESVASRTAVCEWINVLYDAPGTLTVEARPLDTGGPDPLVGADNPGVSSTGSFRVEAGSRIGINVAIPRGIVRQRYEVTTSLMRVR